MRIDGAGNVGIGTTNPVASLDIIGVVSAPSITAQSGILRLSPATAITGLNMGIYDSSPYGSWIQTTNQPASGGGAFPLTLNPMGGNVGIGTTAPKNKLDVEGGVV